MTETTLAPIIGADGFPIDPSMLYAEQHFALNYIIVRGLERSYTWDINIRNFPEFDGIFARDDRFKIQTIFAIFDRLRWLSQSYSSPSYSDDRIRKSVVTNREILQAIFRRNIICTDTDLIDIVHWCTVDYIESVNVVESFGFILPVSGILHWIENYLKSHIYSKPLVYALRTLGDLGLSKTERTLHNRILATYSAHTTFSKIFNSGIGEIWVDTIIEQMETLDTAKKEAWGKLFIHASTSEKSTPSSQWLKTALPLLMELGVEEFKAAVYHWFSLVEESIARVEQIILYHGMMSVHNKQILTGLIWICSLIKDDELLQSIADLTVVCYKKIPGIGPLCLKAGNAGLWLLSEAGTPSAIDCIEELRQKVKNKSIQKQIEKALDRAATKSGLSRQDLEELAIPTYNLDADGKIEQGLGNFTAKLSIIDIDRVELAWFKADDKQQKSIPAEVKQNFADELKTLKRIASDLKNTLTTQRDRIESFYIHTPRTWSFDVWRERYLDRPVMAQLTRRLIWRLGNEGKLGIWHEGRLVDAEGNPLENIGELDRVSLWHPIDSTPETILAWRVWLENNAIVQPFKQAYREVYLFTDAERTTGTYSNRFAAHIIRQHQFAKLCQQRGWNYTLIGNFDGDYEVPNWKLPDWNLQAQFWVDVASSEISDSHIFLYLTTDRVRFCNLATEDAVELATIPALIFSEVMRNVDLFVGVCSISNDPNWQDRGEADLYAEYWHTNSFGKLGMTAQLRREFLARLLPKLKISDRCTLDDKFLIVRGDLTTYQIHLGSGNILTQPGSRYLCIVPGVSNTIKDRVFLPFEGDGILSIILSKAFLLANDRSITDPSILSQITVRDRG
jgi:hypothetical protein